MLNATLLSIGDELLIGQTINTNVSWMAEKLNDIGVNVLHMITLADVENDILKQLDIALSESDIVLITGGLGPTSDDITLSTLCKYFQSELVWNQQVMDNIDQIFALRKRMITEETRNLAFVPNDAIPIYNSQGTAPGTIFYKNGKMTASMPGVPYEMKAMMAETVLPFIQENFQLPFIVHSHILTAGVGETQIAGHLVDFEKALPEHLKLAYLPSLGKVRLRLTGKGDDYPTLQKLVEEKTEELTTLIEPYIYGFNQDTLEGNIGKILLEKKLQLGLAESCTGGFISHAITAIPGASNYFKGGIIAYSNEIKRKVLGVNEETLSQKGAVSEACVEEMLEGALQVLEVDVAVAISGIAGPGGGTKEKPVGTVVIGVGNKDKKYIKTLTFTSDRTKNIQISGTVALVMLRKFLLTIL